jgi:N6-L-threonylcarbamoyladenine synthase
LGAYLGIDTSNYTTSVALLDGEHILQRKKLLPVREGELGLRQSDAVFEHTRQLPALLEECCREAPSARLAAVGFSARPRDQEGSYMPCFLAGESAARSVAAACHITAYSFSHQAGHIAAALYSTGNMQLFESPFICFHFSGGTTDCLLVSPDAGRVFSVELLAASLDLKAGQAVDRVGRMLGLPFPAGAALSALAEQSGQEYRVRLTFRGDDVSLSGVENRCETMLRSGAAAPDIARFCLEHICEAASRMTENALRRCGELPLIYAGGVMCSSYIRPRLSAKYGGAFADPAFSSDNAAGLAVLAMVKELK